jgi:ABC-2 type transport system permease protein
MSAISVPVSSELPAGAVMPASRLFRAYLTEAKYETVRMLRTPAFAIPFLGLPALLYVLFAVVLFGAAVRNDAQAGLFTFAGFALFGVMGPGMFGFGVLVFSAPSACPAKAASSHTSLS